MRIAVSTPRSRSSRQTSNPLFLGSMTSRIIRSNLLPDAFASPVSPSAALSTSYPAAARRSETVRTSPGSSSTNRMRELILVLQGRGWDRHHKLGSFRRLAFDADGSTVRLYDLFLEVQAEPGPVYLVFT